MYRGKRIIVTICARGGSRGLPGKNVRLLNGKPLIAYTIEHAKALSFVDRIIVSTDSREIKDIVENYGVKVPFLRPKNLATSKISKNPAIVHAIKFCEKYWTEAYDIVVDLDPTSPLRTLKDIKGAIDLLIKRPEAKSVITVFEARKNPYFNMIELTKEGYTRLSKRSKKEVACRQAAPEVFSMNGSIYVMWKKYFLRDKKFITNKTICYEMPPERSPDIDSELDFRFVEFLLKRRKISFI